MYPLLLSAPVKSAVWGGDRLEKEYGFEPAGENSAEAWMLSCYGGFESIVKNGPLSGKTLSEAITAMGETCLGENAAKFSYFPILIKLIDANDRLSVQVHPDDEYALKNEGQYGKTEMWLIVDCKEDSEIIYGLKKKVDKTELSERIKNGTLNEICNFVPVKKGDVFFIPSGTVHAIGKGILIAEIQQNSDVTYRVNDYGRLGTDGKPRELRIKKAVDVIDTSPVKTSDDTEGELMLYPFGTVKSLAECKYFTAELLNLNGKAGLCEEKSFLSLVVLEGDAVLSSSEGILRLKKGDSVFIPAKMRATLSGSAEIICTHI